jgi:hypothetical protein
MKMAGPVLALRLEAAKFSAATPRGAVQVRGAHYMTQPLVELYPDMETVWWC